MERHERATFSQKKNLKKRYVTFGYQLECPRFVPDPRFEHAIICNFSLEKKRRKSGNKIC